MDTAEDPLPSPLPSPPPSAPSSGRLHQAFIDLRRQLSEEIVGQAELVERLLIALLAAFVYGLGVPYILPVALAVLAVLVLFTVYQRLVHVYRQANAA